MSTNISKIKREELLAKIKAIRTYIATVRQDDNTAALLAYLAEIEKDVGAKKYGLVFEEHREEIDEILATHTPVLTEDGSLLIDNGGQMNFLLEGDNLASLQLLLKTHCGKIDLIYIDPPYNTGNQDFIYDDHYVNADDLFSHSKWISFMNVRLKVAKKLLKNDGIIFLSIGDIELSDLKLLCDEIFGEKNCLAIVPRLMKTGGNKGRFFSPNIDYVLVYAKNEAEAKDFKVGKIGLEIGMEYSYMNTIIRKLFDANFTYNRKILALEPRQVYSFVLNNADRLRHLVREAMAAELAQMELEFADVTTFEFRIPQSCMFTYDGNAKTQLVMEKNVYQGYLSSAEPRSTPERKFEKFCERTPSVDWFYKNGDKGNEYLSIVYQDNSGKQKLFYPDYIISVKGELWIIETKGGFDRSGNSQDIDMFTPKKFEVLKKYLDKYGLKGGIVRNDDRSDELCICTEHYSDDIQSDDWAVLADII